MSRELTAAAALAGGAAALMAAGPGAALALSRHLRVALAAAVRGEPEPGGALVASLDLLLRTATAPLLGSLAGALAAGLIQTRLFSLPAVAPRWERVDPARGLRRIASWSRAADLALGALRAGLCAGVGIVLLRASAPALSRLPWLHAVALGGAIAAVLPALIIGLLGAILASAAVDYLVVRRRHLRSLRMTRDEVRREAREEEGDPTLRAERRRTHQAVLASGPVAGAAVLIVNPSHLAVALTHRRGADDAPVVLAKAAGSGAARLRTAARRAGVPIVHDVCLARSLFRLAEVGEAIPEELYQAAAAVLVQVHGLSREALS